MLDIGRNDGKQRSMDQIDQTKIAYDNQSSKKDSEYSFKKFSSNHASDLKLLEQDLKIENKAKTTKNKHMRRKMPLDALQKAFKEDSYESISKHFFSNTMHAPTKQLTSSSVPRMRTDSYSTQAK